MKSLLFKFIWVPFIVALLTPYAVKAQEQQFAKRAMKLVKYDLFENLVDDLQSVRPDLKITQADPVLAAKAKAVLTTLDIQYRVLFPELMKNKTFPEYVIVDSDSAADTFAFTSFDIPGTDSYRGFIVIPRGSLNDSKQVSILMGVMSHELAHLFLNHHNIDYTILNMWKSEAPHIPVSKKARAAFQSYLENASVAGPYSQEQLLGFPLDDSILLTNFLSLMRSLKSQHGEADCVKQIDSLAKASVNFMASDFSYFDWNLKISSEAEGKAISDGLGKLEQHLISCSKDLGFQGTSLRKQRFPSGPTKISSEPYISLKLGAFKWANQNEFEVLFSLGKVLHREMRKLWKQNQLEQIRWRSFEDEADEFAVTILRAAKLPETDFASSFLDYFEKSAPGFTAQCKEAISSGRTIPFGFLGDAHHSTCYRLKRLEQLAADQTFSAKP